LAPYRRSRATTPLSRSRFRHGNVVYVVETKICVSTTGDVDTVTLTKPSDSALDGSVLNTVKTWRYRPLMMKNTPVAFWYPARFEFRSGR
jgi:TonB family protein